MADQLKVDETVDFESEFGESGTAFPMPDALKSENIKCFYLPTIYNSKESKRDDYQLAKNLNVDIDTISIEM